MKKIKRIAALLLAGVMALSMLVGCGTTTGGNNSADGVYSELGELFVSTLIEETNNRASDTKLTNNTLLKAVLDEALKNIDPETGETEKPNWIEDIQIGNDAFYSTLCMIFMEDNNTAHLFTSEEDVVGAAKGAVDIFVRGTTGGTIDAVGVSYRVTDGGVYVAFAGGLLNSPE